LLSIRNSSVTHLGFLRERERERERERDLSELSSQ
jgi:hypothetical protein